MNRPFELALRAFKANPNRETAIIFFQEVIRRHGDEPNSDGYVFRDGPKYMGVRVYGPGRKDALRRPWLTLYSGINGPSYDGPVIIGKCPDDEVQFWFELHTTPCLEEIWVLPKRMKRLPVVQTVEEILEEIGQ